MLTSHVLQVVGRQEVQYGTSGGGCPDKHLSKLSKPLRAMGSNQQRFQAASEAKQRGMAAALADILDQLDDASRLADEIDTHAV